MSSLKHSKFSVDANYIGFKALQLEGYRGTEDLPMAAISVQRVTVLFGLLPSEHAPSSYEVLTEAQIKVLDEHAKKLRYHHYYRVRSIEEIRGHLHFFEGLVSINVPVFEQWYGAENGVIQFPSSGEEPIEMHAVSVCGYDHDSQYLLFVNSWGSEWGDRGKGWLPYSYFDEYATDSFACQPSDHGVKLLGRYLYFDNFIAFAWTSVHPFRGFVLGYSIYDKTKDQAIAWLHAHPDGGQIHCEEFFVAPDYRNRGLAKVLDKGLRSIARHFAMPFRIFVPNIDNLLLNGGLRDVAFSMKYSVKESNVRWASHILVPKN